MSRRRVIAKREILPDPKFKNKTLAKFINHVMVNGKTQYVDLEKLRVVKDAAWRSGKKEETEILWADRFKE